jgi:hypothetical protein
MFALLEATDHTKPVMEPYEIRGNRIVFTNWFYVRPGHFDWLDKDGESVYTSRAAKLGPYEAKFVSYDTPQGVQLFVEPAQRVIPIIPADKPWDTFGIRPTTLIKEKGIFRMWANCCPDNLNYLNCYFESKDGIVWEKPDLGLVEFEGSKNNNLITASIGISIFVDPEHPKERYKSMWHSRIAAEEFEKYKDKRPWSYYALELDRPLVHVLKGAVSPDGLQWEELPDPIAIEHADTQNLGYFDSETKKYVIFIRTHMVGSRASGQPYPPQKFHQRVSRRAIGRTESPNFRSFPLSEVVIEPGPDMHPSEQFYTNCYTTIPGAPDHHLMFPTVYNVADDGAKVVLYSSHNGKNWHRISGPPVAELQPFGEPDGGWLLAHPNLVERPNGDWVLPYEGYDVPHKYARGAYRFEPGLLVWPKGRLVGIEAREEGSFATAYLIIKGSKIKINALTSRAGFIKTELVDMELNPVKGFTFGESDAIIGNQYLTELSWNKNSTISEMMGKPLMLRFKMKRAKIYGLHFE